MLRLLEVCYLRPFEKQERIRAYTIKLNLLTSCIIRPILRHLDIPASVNWSLFKNSTSWTSQGIPTFVDYDIHTTTWNKNVEIFKTVWLKYFKLIL